MTTDRRTATVSLTLLIIGLIFAAANMRSPIVIIGSVASILDEVMGLGAADIGYLGALPMPLFALGALFAPAVARRFGLERMMIAMTLILAVGVAMRVWFGVAALFIGTLILSLAIGMLNALTAPFIKKYAPNSIAVATGVFSLSMSTIAGVSAWVVVPMADNIGWQVAMSVWAVFGLITAAIWLFIYRTAGSDDAAPTQTVGGFSPWRSASAWQMAVLIGLQSVLFYTIASFLPSIGAAAGLEMSAATRLAFVFQIMAPPAILLLTYLIKRGISMRLVGVTGSAFNAIGVAGMLWLPEQLTLWSALMGLGCAAVFTLSLMMFSLRTSNTENARDLSGMVQAVGYSLAFFGPLLMGKLFELTGGWDTPLLMLFVLMLINVPFGFLASSESKVDG